MVRGQLLVRVASVNCELSIRAFIVALGGGRVLQLFGDETILIDVFANVVQLLFEDAKAITISFMNPNGFEWKVAFVRTLDSSVH